jgi:hypothetical protein
MWCTVLVLAIVATLDPVRLGISVLLCSRPRPVPHLVAFWLGGLTISAALALGVLFGLHDFVFGVMHRVELATASSTAGHVQIAMGVLALLIAGFAIGLSPRHRARLAMPGTGASHAQVLTSTAFSRLWTRVHCALQAKRLWVPYVLGMGMLTDFRYLAALTAILASGAAAGTQVSAAGVYALIALAFVEIPLASQLAAPATTGATMSRVHGWMRARRQQAFAVVIALLGVFLMTAGMGHV